MGRGCIVSGFILLIFSSCSHSYYIVRHAEKVTDGTHVSGDVPLTENGKDRAETLKNILKNKRIAYVFSTNTIRTKSTAQPTAGYFRLTTEIYGPGPDSVFIGLLKTKKKNTLIVGHSNTVDEVVNKLCGKIILSGDLPESEYDNLFIVKKKGKKMSFTRHKYGKPSG